MEAGVQPSQIAIITPSVTSTFLITYSCFFRSRYQAQSQILSTMIPEPELEIGTVDGMQGREREAVVLTLVRSNPEVRFFSMIWSHCKTSKFLCVVGRGRLSEGKTSVERCVQTYLSTGYVPHITHHFWSFGVLVVYWGNSGHDACQMPIGKFS